MPAHRKQSIGGRGTDPGEIMSAGSNKRRTVKIRRRGRHATPSQVEKVAAQAGKAAPAMAIAGALVTAPQLAHSPANHHSVPAAKATLDSIITSDASGTGAT